MTPLRNPRQRAHDRLDFLLDYAEREQLWGDVSFKALLQDGLVVKLDFTGTLGEKFDN